MPELRLYSLFISHAWRYDQEYHRLVEMLGSARNFSWRNYSVPSHDPVIDPNTILGKRKLTELLRGQIKYVNCVLVLCGMYAAYSDWIEAEISISASMTKPIIGVLPWGRERIPAQVTAASVQIVGWNTDSIVSAVRRWSN